MRYFQSVALLITGCLALAGCGGGGGGKTVEGTVVDGYVSGATVYLVPVGDTGISQALHHSRPTGDNGQFKIAISNKQFNDPAAYHLIAVGGTDTATSAAAPVYSSPVNTTVVSPLTTLLDQLAVEIAGGSQLTPDSIQQAAAHIATVAGIDQNKAQEIILNTDYLSQAAADSNAQKALALSFIIAQLSEQQVIDSSFNGTMSKLVTAMKQSSPTTINDLMVAAAGSDETAQARALVVAESVMRTMNETVVALDASSTCATTMARLQYNLNKSLAASLSGVTKSNAYTYIVSITGGSYVDVGKSSSPADLSSQTVKDYLISSVSSGPVQALLGIDISTIPLVASAAAPQHGASAARRAQAVNYCAGVANGTTTTVTVPCSGLFSTSFCQGPITGFEATATCTGPTPTLFTVALDNFAMPGFNSKLSGTLVLAGNSMTFTNITNGNTTYNGSINYGFDSATSAISFAVNNGLTVTSTSTAQQWKSLSLDSLTHGTITPAADVINGINDMNVYLSGTGTTSSNTQMNLGLDYHRQQSATIGSDKTDNVSITLNGTISNGSMLRFNNFQVNEQRTFASQTDQVPLYQLESFASRSQLLTSADGYAYFNGSNIRFDYVNNVLTYKSGNLSLSTTAP